MHAASSLLPSLPVLTRFVIILRLFYFALGCDKNEEECGSVPAALSLRRACFFHSSLHLLFSPSLPDLLGAKSTSTCCRRNPQRCQGQSRRWTAARSSLSVFEAAAPPCTFQREETPQVCCPPPRRSHTQPEKLVSVWKSEVNCSLLWTLLEHSGCRLGGAPLTMNVGFTIPFNTGLSWPFGFRVKL